MRPRSFVSLAGLALLAAACGGGAAARPTAVSTPAPTPTPTPPLTILDGWTHAPVAEASTLAVPAGAPLAVRAPGFLFREQPFTPTVYLWRDEEDYVKELVYSWPFTDGSFRMVRWAGPFTITLDGDLAENDSVIAKAHEVASEIKRVTGIDVAVGPGGACVVALNSNIIATDDAVGLARLSFQGASIVRAEVTFANRGEITGGGGSDYRNTLLHEMGHVLGVGHSLRGDDVMTPGQGPGTRVGQYQPHEATALHMMYSHRTAGNRLPDKDAALGAASSAHPRETVIRN